MFQGFVNIPLRFFRIAESQVYENLGLSKSKETPVYRPINIAKVQSEKFTKKSSQHRYSLVTTLMKFHFVQYNVVVRCFHERSNTFVSNWYTEWSSGLENFHGPRQHHTLNDGEVVPLAGLLSASACKHRDDPNLLRNGWTPLMKFQVSPRVTKPVIALDSFARSTLRPLSVFPGFVLRLGFGAVVLARTFLIDAADP